MYRAGWNSTVGFPIHATDAAHAGDVRLTTQRNVDKNLHRAKVGSVVRSQKKHFYILHVRTYYSIDSNISSLREFGQNLRSHSSWSVVLTLCYIC